MEPALTLANTPLDIQITICLFLHPSDILALRKTCKVFELATRTRIVWVAALHRICLDNTLFLPSFPIPDMTDLELERAAMAPRRWIKLCGAFQKQHSDESSEMLHPRTTRILLNKDVDSSEFFLVPGGRYLVTAGRGLMVWDLGYVSTVDCKLVASVGPEDDLSFDFCEVQATADGMGLIILSTYRDNRFSIFEIYPQSEIPLLTQIADLDWISSDEYPAHLLPDTLICHVSLEDRIVFRVVDYRTNYSSHFSAEVNKKEIGGRLHTFATKTAIIVISKEDILIWATPPLSPEQSNLRHFLDNNSTHTQPLLKIPFPGGIVHHIPIFARMLVSSWYFASWDSIYFDILFEASMLQRYKIIVHPDLSDASLHAINETEAISVDLMKSLKLAGICGGYKVCEDHIVYFWNNRRKTWGAYAGLTSPPFNNVVTRWNGKINALCPTSGRFVYSTDEGDRRFLRMVVADLF